MSDSSVFSRISSGEVILPPRKRQRINDEAILELNDSNENDVNDETESICSETSEASIISEGVEEESKLYSFN